MTTQITIRKAPGKYVVRAGGAVLGESSDVLELSEGTLAPVLYFPRSAIAMAFLEPSGTTSQCPMKGVATHYSVVTKSTTLTDIAWSYEAPLDAASDIAGHLSFSARDTLAVEQL